LALRQFYAQLRNMIPLNQHTIEGIANAVEPYDFELLHGVWWDFLVADASSAVKLSAKRYIGAISE